jgi:hypothetical protein
MDHEEGLVVKSVVFHTSISLRGCRRFLVQCVATASAFDFAPRLPTISCPMRCNRVGFRLLALTAFKQRIRNFEQYLAMRRRIAAE